MAEDFDIAKALIDAFDPDEDQPQAEPEPQAEQHLTANGKPDRRRIKIQLPLDELAALILSGASNFALRDRFGVSQTVIKRSIAEAVLAGLIDADVLAARKAQGQRRGGEASKRKPGRPRVRPLDYEVDDEKPDEPPGRTDKPDDETVLDWWIAYDNGDTPQYIADRWDWSVKVVIEALNDLGVLFEQRHPAPTTNAGYDSIGRQIVAKSPSHKATDNIELDQDLVRRALRGALTPKERAMYDALGKLLGAPFWEDPEKQYTPTLYVNPRHPNGGRIRIPMSHRERKQNQMASSKWRRIVRRDMEAIGIMPGRTGSRSRKHRH